MDEVEAGPFSKGSVESKWPRPIRLVSWNIERGLQLQKVIGFLREASADVVVLQEADVFARRTGYRHIPQEIARALELNFVFGREFEELGQARDSVAAYHGQATLSRLPLSNARVLRFQCQSGFWRPRWYVPRLAVSQRRLGGRIALVTDIALGEASFTVFNVHLESRGGDELRLRQLSEVFAEMKRVSSERRLIVAGDFNFDVSRGIAASYVSNILLENPFARLDERGDVRRIRGFEDGAIDWILTGPGIAAAGPEVHQAVHASDHFPLSLDIEFV